MRSLTGKLIIAFLLISMLGIGLAAIVARAITAREFGNFVLGQLRNEYVANAESFYERQGSWSGAGDYVRRLDADTPAEPGSAPRPPQFVLADERGNVITPVQPYGAGERVPRELLDQGVPVKARGQMVGTVIDVARAPALSPRELQYLRSTNQALSYAALGAIVVALLVGVVLARSLTRPVRDLTHAIEAMAGGELKQQVPVRSNDELGTLTRAFNRLSADLAHANELRRQMTADIAHDLRTPLSVINAYIDGLREGVFRPTPARFDAMHAEIQHLQHLVEDLRTLSLADAGELAMQPIATGCGALLQRMALAYAPQAEERRIALEVSVEPGLPDIYVDCDRMTQVLGNLVTNAFRYTPEGGRIGLLARRSAGKVALVVEDNGRGVAPDVLPHVFDRFFRGDAARSQEGGESGLGLAIARSIAEAHGGTLEAESTPGERTAFTLLLPVA